MGGKTILTGRAGRRFIVGRSTEGGESKYKRRRGHERETIASQKSGRKKKKRAAYLTDSSV